VVFQIYERIFRTLKVSVLIPVFNEKNTIIEILKKIDLEKKNLIKINFEIIVINDGSIDGSKDLLEKNSTLYSHLVSYEKNRGKGYALRQGLKHATGDVCLIQDADLEYLPENYKNLLLPFEKYDADIVYGSRFKGTSVNKVLLFWHMVANKIITLCSNIFSNLNFTDVEVGFKVLKTDIIKKIELKEDSFAIEIEITQKISKIKPKPRIFEVGTSYYGRSYSEGKKITFKDAIFAMIAIIRHSL
jgi:glycosyltransferase involved in cell wall biosynthesis